MREEAGCLEVTAQLSERRQFEKMLPGWGLVHDLVLEDPGEVVGDEDRVDASRESWVNVRARAVADHPGVAGLATVVGDQGAVGVVVLFVEDLDGSEVGGEARALELVGLLFGVALSDHDQSVAGGEVGEGRGNVREELDLLVGDGLGEAFDPAVLLGGEGHVGELLEAGNQGVAKTV